jgi:hypothetical protein
MINYLNIIYGRVAPITDERYNHSDMSRGNVYQGAVGEMVIRWKSSKATGLLSMYRRRFSVGLNAEKRLPLVIARLSCSCCCYARYKAQHRSLIRC